MIYNRHVALATALVLLCADAGGAPRPSSARWAGAWGYAPSPATAATPPTRPAGRFQYRLRLTRGGSELSLRLGNPERSLPLSVTAMTVAVEGRAAVATQLEFGGSPGLRLGAGTMRDSDPVPLPVRAGDTVVVTLSTDAPSTQVSGNAGFVGSFAGTDDVESESRDRPFVTLASVRATARCTIVALGDSITEGARNQDTVRRGWPDRLAERLARSSGLVCGVVNAGISGNRLLRAGRGVAAVDRFERDVAAVPGVTHLIVLEGINDLVRGGQPDETPVTSADLIGGYRRIIAAAHARGIKVIGGTLTPAWGYRLMTPALEGVRVDTNRWIRTSGAFDAVVDFEAAVSIGEAVPVLRSDADSGDKLHPGDVGYAAMAAAIPLELFD